MNRVDKLKFNLEKVHSLFFHIIVFQYIPKKTLDIFGQMEFLTPDWTGFSLSSSLSAASLGPQIGDQRASIKSKTSKNMADLSEVTIDDTYQYHQYHLVTIEVTIVVSQQITHGIA